MTVNNSKQQNSLLAAIADRSHQATFNQAGLAAYRRNLQANAARALSISFPVTYELLGEELFQSLVSEFLAVSLPEIGDWAEWGSKFPDWLNSHKTCEEIPYISDCAKLDWLHHQAERAEDYNFEPESYQQLADQNAAAGTLIVNPTSQVFTSDYPVVDIWLAHNLPEKDRAEFMASAREKLAEQKGQTVLLWRQHWQVQVRAIHAEECHWLEYLSAGFSLEKSLNQLEEDFSAPGFAFDQWLPGAIESHLVTGFIANDE